MLGYCRRVLFKEPFRGPLPWSNLAVGCFCLLSGAFMAFSGGLTFMPGPMNVALGLMFLFWGASDLLPGGRKRSIVALRVGFLIFQSASLVLGVAGLLQAVGL